ncbi:MAG: FGGY family carbohydrate kinase [Victivallaceae bacterium]|nr:FGGY family carbohydrate kinase [Victivallaceae bacterium]
MDCYLGIDVGTTAVKAAVFDASGTMRGAGLAEYRLETPAPDVVELETEVYWQAVKEAVAAASKKSGVAVGEIVSVAVTGQAETLIAVDDCGAPLRKAIVWLDNRAKEEAAELEKQFGTDYLFRLSGQTEMLPCWPAAKILWLKRHEPELFAKTAKFLMVEDYIGWRLTGCFATCRGLMPSSLYYDIAAGEYAADILNALGISADRLPQLKDPGENIGICRELVPGAALAAAPLDHVCGCLGAGGKPGVVTETTGCTLALCAVLPRLFYDASSRLGTYCGFEPSSYVFLPWAPTAGMLLRRFRDEFSGGLGYDELGKLAAAVAPGSDGLVMLPHCAGAVSPETNPEARGVIYGITLAHQRGHFARAIMESVAFLLRDNLEALLAMGVEIKELRSLGGASKSPVWMQIKADVLNLPVIVPDLEEATAFGAAVLGAVGAGRFKSASAAVESMPRRVRRYEPGSDRAVYDEVFRKYKEINQLLLPTFGGEK